MRAVAATRKLFNGAPIPVLGFGTWQAPADETIRAVRSAIECGFRLIDCAKVYRNEAAVGEAISRAVADKIVTREELFVVGKVWNTDHAPADVRAAAVQTIQDLQVGYLDLLLIHWPIAWRAGSGLFPSNDKGGCHAANVPILDTWRAMEALVDDGLVRAIGVSNFSEAQVREVYDAARIKPAANQVEMHPSLPQEGLRALHAKLGIVTMAYCPLAVGAGRPMSESLVGRAEVQAIAAKAGMTAGQLLLQWGCGQRDTVVLSKSVTPARIAENAATPVDPLPAAVADALEAFGRSTPMRTCNPGIFFEEPRPFFADP